LDDLDLVQATHRPNFGWHRSTEKADPCTQQTRAMPAAGPVLPVAAPRFPTVLGDETPKHKGYVGVNEVFQQQRVW